MENMLWLYIYIEKKNKEKRGYGGMVDATDLKSVDSKES